MAELMRLALFSPLYAVVGLSIFLTLVSVGAALISPFILVVMISDPTVSLWVPVVLILAAIANARFAMWVTEKELVDIDLCYYSLGFYLFLLLVGIALQARWS